MIFRSILQFFSLTFLSKSDLEADLKHVLDTYPHDPKCAFNHTQLNSTTIKFFPKCNEVFGIIVINEKSDVSESQLRNMLANVTLLTGGFHIENSKLTDLFFIPLTTNEYFFVVNCESYGIHIVNNPVFDDIRWLQQFRLVYEKNENKECDVRIENNPKLDSGQICWQGDLWRLMNLRVKNNKIDCGCQGDEISLSSLPLYKNCTHLNRGFKLHNITESADLSFISGIQSVKGTLDIQNTNFQNLSFLENFKSLTISNPGVVHNMAFILKNNPQMTRLAFPKFEEMRNLYEGIKLAIFENLHPDFCLTYPELHFFLKSWVSFINFQVKICEGPQEIPGVTSCIFQSMKKLPNNCETIFGNVVIGSGEETFFMKLDTVQYLIGTLTITNTTLKKLDSLHRLEYIFQTGTGPIIQIVGNKKMVLNKQDLHIIPLNGVYTLNNNQERQAVFQDNNPNIFKSYGGKCRLIDPIFPSESTEYQTRLNFTGGDCGKRVEIASQAFRWDGFIPNWVLTFLFFWLTV